MDEARSCQMLPHGTTHLGRTLKFRFSEARVADLTIKYIFSPVVTLGHYGLFHVSLMTAHTIATKSNITGLVTRPAELQDALLFFKRV